MIDQFEDDIKPNLISDKKLFIRILTSPKEAFNFINTYQYQKHVSLLLVLAGISRTFDRASTKNMGDNFSLWGVIAFCIIIGAICGSLIYYLYSAMISWTGKWLNGKGNTDSILRVMAYALIPSILALLFLIPQIAICGNEMFKSDGDITSGGIISNIIVYGSILLEFSLGIWTIVLCVIGLSEVQKISIAKSILNLFLPAIVIIVPVLAIALIVSAFN